MKHHKINKKQPAIQLDRKSTEKREINCAANGKSHLIRCLNIKIAWNWMEWMWFLASLVNVSPKSIKKIFSNEQKFVNRISFVFTLSTPLHCDSDTHKHANKKTIVEHIYTLDKWHSFQSSKIIKKKGKKKHKNKTTIIIIGENSIGTTAELFDLTKGMDDDTKVYIVLKSKNYTSKQKSTHKMKKEKCWI